MTADILAEGKQGKNKNVHLVTRSPSHLVTVSHKGVPMSAQVARPFKWYDYITTNIYFLGLSTLSQTLTPYVMPLLVQQFVGEAGKGTFLGTLRLWSLMVALIAQAFWGILSDRTRSRWGRRRPYIFWGTVANLIFIGLIGAATGMSGWTGYWFLFGISLVQQVASNAPQAAQQGVIPDLVPENLRGRFSAVKAVFEVPLPLILSSLVIATLIGGGNMIGGIAVAVGVLVFGMVCAMFIPEQPLREQLSPLDWTPFARLIGMTALFTAIILGMGWGTQFIATAMAGISDVTVLLIVMGIVGLIAMLVAVALGVWASVQISIGSAARENPSFAWWIINRLAFLVGTVNLSSFAVYFLQGRLGLQGQAAVAPARNLLLIVGIMILVLALVSGWISDRFGHKRVVAAAGIIAGLGALVAIAIPNLTVIYIGGLMIGVGTGMFYTANWALGTQLVPKAEAGRYLGISNLAGAGAGAVGAYIGGPIADYFTARFPSMPGLGYILLFAIYGILFLLSVVALTRVRVPSENQLQPQVQPRAVAAAK